MVGRGRTPTNRGTNGRGPSPLVRVNGRGPSPFNRGRAEDSQVLTTITDEGTGTTYSLYGTTPLLLDYPIPPPAVFESCVPMNTHSLYLSRPL